ncbi:MAG: GTP-binding protein, partial [Proteiniphilum sp.]|nr:GTP-binding protein [Proteiniphilum sp.]
MRLSELKTGDQAYILKVNGSGAFRKRILEMGFVRGQEVKSILNAPLKDPIKYGIMDYEVSLRRSEAVLIEISKIRDDIERYSSVDDKFDFEEDNIDTVDTVEELDAIEKLLKKDDSSRVINVALVGNPNAGKTSIFNLASGAHEHVGNYGGVTVDAKEGIMRHNGYTFRLIDLPGTYSLSAYSPEEIYVRKYIFDEKPDVIINVVSASALERNLYLTTELMELECPMVMALNMFDELKKSERQLDYEALSAMLNVPIVPTVGKKGTGIPELLDSVINLFEDKEPPRFVPIPYGRVLEKSISVMSRELSTANGQLSGLGMPLRYLSIKLLEGDEYVEKDIKSLDRGKEYLARRDKEDGYMERLLKEDAESA